MEKEINKIYTNPGNAGSFGGVRNLYLAVKEKKKNVTLNDVKKYLWKKRSYTLHKDLRRKHDKLKTTASGIGTSTQSDLLEFSGYKDQNDGFAFLLVVVDVFSRLVNSVPLKNKSSTEVKRGLETIFDSWLYPWAITTDRNDFSSKELKKFYQEHEIIHYECFTSPDVHCAIVENVNKQITAKLGRYFTEFKTFKWIDVVDKIVDGINNRHSRTLGLAPVEVTQENSDLIRKKMKKTQPRERNPKYKKGEHVRIEKKKEKFQKGWVPKFTEEVFVVDKTFKNKAPPTYLLKDWGNEKISGRFYEEDFSKVLVDKDTEFPIEKILKTRKRRGKTEWFVKFVGYSDKFNAWVAKID